MQEKKSPVLPDDVFDALAQALPPIDPPPERAAALREQVLGRVHASRADHETIRAEEGKWHAIAPGVTRKMLHRDVSSEIFLLRLAPGAELPAHGHALDEACYVIEGTARLGDVYVEAGDYHHAQAGSIHGVVTSDTGALLLLRAAGGAGLAF